MGKIGIIGYGVVGEAVAHGFREKNPSHKIKIYDKYKTRYNSLEKVVKDSDFSFVCLPTPSSEKGIDISVMDDCIKEISEIDYNHDGILIIKSTIVPGTTRNYSKQYPQLKFAFSPEFLTEANYLKDAPNPDRIVIGADDKIIGSWVYDLFVEDFSNVPIFRTDTVTAEMAKYAPNCFLAAKVMFANEMSDVCEKLGIKWDDVKEMMLADRRIGQSHLDVTPERGFGGKCFPKDVMALIGYAKELCVETPILETIWQRNLEIRKEKDWKKIPGTSPENVNSYPTKE